MGIEQCFAEWSARKKVYEYGANPFTYKTYLSAIRTSNSFGGRFCLGFVHLAFLLDIVDVFLFHFHIFLFHIVVPRIRQNCGFCLFVSKDSRFKGLFKKRNI